jgi:DNA-binding transcriptional ArsR family regulator
MSAMPDNIVPFELPKRPRIKQQEAPPDLRRMAVVPLRAVADDKLSDASFRSLALICSYTNRAGITWVSQKTLAKAIGMSQQAISKHLIKLKALGYVEVMKKPFPGERSTTWRVIFDPTVDAQTAIAVTSSIEDTRPPYMREEQEQQANQENQQRIAQLLATALKGSNKEKQQAMNRTNPQGDTITTRKMKQEIAEHQAKRTRKQTKQPVDNPTTSTTSEVVSKAQPNRVRTTTSEVVRNEENTSLIRVLREYLKEVKEEEIEKTLNQLRDAYAVEGLQPPADPERLATELQALLMVSRGLT